MPGYYNHNEGTKHFVLGLSMLINKVISSILFYILTIAVAWYFIIVSVSDPTDSLVIYFRSKNNATK